MLMLRRLSANIKKRTRVGAFFYKNKKANGDFRIVLSHDTFF